MGRILKTVFDIFAAAAGKYPARPFLHIPAVATKAYADGPVDLTYAEALTQIERLRDTYAAAGYGPGHRIALMLDNRAEFFLYWLALNDLGAGIVPLSREASIGELAHVITLSEPVLAVSITEATAHLQAVIDAVETTLPIIVAGDGFAPPAVSAAALDILPGADTECAMLFTSGSTGRPKGCILSNAYFTLFGEWYEQLGGLCALEPGADRLLTPLPLTHMNALSCSTMGMIQTGGCIIQLDRFHPSTWWQTVGDTGATVIHYLGIMPAILLTMDRAEAEHDHSVRFGFGAGSDPRHQKTFEGRFGFPLVEGWAMTETGSGGCIMANHEPRHVGTRCFGRLPDAMEARIVDDSDTDVSMGNPGELLVRANGDDPRRGFFSGYHKDEAATDEAWQGGWLHTGDIVRQGDDGSFHFVDRKKAIIRRSGENISASEVEGALLSLADVAQAAVAPVPDDIREEEVMACIITTDDVPPGKIAAIRILEALRGDLSYFKLPGYIAFVDELPLTASQKLRRGDIKPLCASLVESGQAIDLRDLKRHTRKGESTGESPGKSKE